MASRIHAAPALITRSSPIFHEVELRVHTHPFIKPSHVWHNNRRAWKCGVCVRRDWIRWNYNAALRACCWWWWWWISGTGKRGQKYADVQMFSFFVRGCSLSTDVGLANAAGWKVGLRTGQSTFYFSFTLMALAALQGASCSSASSTFIHKRHSLQDQANHQSTPPPEPQLVKVEKLGDSPWPEDPHPALLLWPPPWKLYLMWIQRLQATQHAQRAGDGWRSFNSRFLLQGLPTG